LLAASGTDSIGIINTVSNSYTSGSISSPTKLAFFVDNTAISWALTNGTLGVASVTGSVTATTITASNGSPAYTNINGGSATAGGFSYATFTSGGLALTPSGTSSSTTWQNDESSGTAIVGTDF